VVVPRISIRRRAVLVTVGLVRVNRNAGLVVVGVDFASFSHACFSSQMLNRNPRADAADEYALLTRHHNPIDALGS